MNSMEQIAQALVAPGKGILAADESTPTITKRFKGIQVECTEENRRDYRAALFGAPGLGEFISGIILFDETLRQKNQQGVPLVKRIQDQGIIPGIKVDKGTKPLVLFPNEKITEGLDGLRDRLNEYRELGAKFSKWRAVITIGESIPTDFCLEANAHALARYAALSQEAGLVPVVEPEVLMDGNHSIERCFDATERTLKRVFDALYRHRVVFEQMLLKASMVIAGSEAPAQSEPSEVAQQTLACLKRTVPAAVPGIVFLSGGQSDIRATENLNEMNRIGGVPWQLSFSYGRALQAPALKAWAGSPANVGAAQQALLLRARCNSAARYGNYTAAMEAS